MNFKIGDKVYMLDSIGQTIPDFIGIVSKKLGQEYWVNWQPAGFSGPWKEKQLSSSAMGDNLLKYFDMGGRIIIDLMKVAMRDYKLDSFKLDNVASTFIREKIICCFFLYLYFFFLFPH